MVQEKLAEFLDSTTDFLFPSDLIGAFEKTQTVKEMSAETMLLLKDTLQAGLLEQSSTPDGFIERKQLGRNVEELLWTLTRKEREVLKYRFGFAGGDRDGMTLDEVAEIFEVSRERIRQVEAKALRKLRHPSMSRHLKQFIDADYEPPSKKDTLLLQAKLWKERISK
jgi:RNA polymerase sigma factor (sigma-70 family)